MSPWRTWLVVSAVCKVMLDSPVSGWRARAKRARRRAAKAGSGSMGVGAVRSASNGSGTASVLVFRVGAAKRQPRAHQERFGGVDGAVENLGDVGDRQVIQVAERQHRAMLRRQLLQGCPRTETVEVDVPGILSMRMCNPTASPATTISRGRSLKWFQAQYHRAGGVHMRLKDLVVIVTGAGSGIGRATALRFAQEGARVVLVDRNEAWGATTLSLVNAEGGDAHLVVADVSRGSDAERIVDETVRVFGR